MSQTTGPADESDVISALSALANQAELHQGPAGGSSSQPSHVPQEDQLFAADAPLPTSPGQQLLDLPPTDYNGLAFSADKDHRLQKTPGRENNFDADAVLERYYRSGAGPPEGDMSSVAGPSSSGGPGAAGPSAGTDVKAKTVKLTLQPFATEWIKANYEAHESFSVPRDAMFKSYTAACESQNISPVNSATFGKSVKAAFAEGAIKMRRLGERGRSRYNYSGLRPSNVAEEENVRKFGQLDDASGNGGPASKDASGSNLGRSQSPGPQIDPSLGLRVNGKLRPPSGLPGGLDKGKRRASPDTPDHPHGLQSMAKRSRRDSPPTDWSSATQEGRYIVALNNAFESIREVVPALREAAETGYIDGIQAPRTNGRVTTLNLTRDYILHLQQERQTFLAERERHERDLRSLEELFRSEGRSGDVLAEWRRTRDDADRLEPPVAAPVVPAEDLFNLQQQQQQQHDDNLASLEAFAREEHSNLFHSPSLEDQLQSLHQHNEQQERLEAQQAQVGGDDDVGHPVDSGDFGYLGHETYDHGPSAEDSSGHHESGRLPTPGDSVAFLSAIASEPAYTFDPATGSMSEDAEERRQERVHRELKERNKAKQARYRAKQKAKVRTLQAENQRFKAGSAEVDDGRTHNDLQAPQQLRQHSPMSHDPQQQLQSSHPQQSEPPAQHVPSSSAGPDLNNLDLHHDDAMTPEEARMLNSMAAVDPSLMEGLDEEGNLAALSGLSAVGVSHDHLAEYHA